MSANTSCDKFEDKAEDQAPPLAFHPALPLKPLSLGPAGEHVLSNKPQPDKRCHLTSADRSDPNQSSVQAWHPIMSGIWFDMYLAVRAKCSPPPLPHWPPQPHMSERDIPGGSCDSKCTEQEEDGWWQQRLWCPAQAWHRHLPPACMGSAGTQQLCVRKAGIPLLEFFALLKHLSPQTLKHSVWLWISKSNLPGWKDPKVHECRHEVTEDTIVYSFA